MSGSVLTQVSETQRQKATTVNENFTAVQVAALFGRKAPGISGLTWAYFGGMLFVAGIATAIADGTVALTNTATNYVEATTAGVVSANTSGFTSGRIPLYTVTTAGGVITGYTDYRAPNSVGDLTIAGTIAVGNGSAAAPSITFASDTDTGIFRQAANAVGIAGNGVEIARFVGVASATRGFTFTNSNGGNPTIDVTAGGLTITPATTLSGALTAAAATFSGTVSHTNSSPFSVTNSQVVTFSTTAQTVGAATITIPNFAGVSDTLAFLTLAQQLDGKTLNASVGKGTWTTSGTWTLPAHTLGGTISGGGNQINNVIIGTATPLAGAFTTLSATGTLTLTGLIIDTGGATNLSIKTNAGTEQLRVNHTASATRYITLTGSNGGNPTIGTSAGSLAISSPLYLTSSTDSTLVGASLEFYKDSTPTSAGAIGPNVPGGAVSDGMIFSIYNAGWGEKARFNAAGYFKASVDGTYQSATGVYHEFSANASNDTVRVRNTLAAGTDPFGVDIFFSAQAPNNTTSYFAQGHDSSAQRFALRANGGLANFSANNVNLSTLIVKRDARKYTEAELEAFGQALERVDWGVWKYKDQTHDDFNHGPSVEGVREAFGGVKAAAWALPSLIDLFDEEKGLEGLVTHDLANIAFASLIHSNKQLRGEIAALRKSIH